MGCAGRRQPGLPESRSANSYQGQEKRPLGTGELQAPPSLMDRQLSFCSHNSHSFPLQMDLAVKCRVV